MTGDVDGEYRILAFRYTETGDLAMPADPGTWRVQEAYMFELLHGRTIDKVRWSQKIGQGAKVYSTG